MGCSQDKRVFVRRPVIQDKIEPLSVRIRLAHLLVKSHQFHSTDLTTLAIGDLAGTGIDHRDQSCLSIGPRLTGQPALTMAATLVHGSDFGMTSVSQLIAEQQHNRFRMLNGVLIGGQNCPPIERILRVRAVDETLGLLPAETESLEHLVDTRHTATGQPGERPTDIHQPPAGNVNTVPARRLVQ